jgi:hypothetical protein
VQGFFSPQRRPAKDPEKQRDTRRLANDHRCLHRLSTVLSTARGRNSPADERMPPPLHFNDTVMRAAGSASCGLFLGRAGLATEASIAWARAVGAQSAGRPYGTLDRERVRAITGITPVVELVPPRSLPRTSSGKLSRTKARNLYLSGEIQPYDIAA